MVKEGYKGSLAAIVLRRAMTNLMSPTEDMSDLIFEIGLHIYDATGQMKSFIEIMGEMSDRLVGASDEYKNMVFEVLFGRRAIAGQIVLFNKGSVALRQYAREIENASGTTARVAGKQMKAFTEVLGQLWREMQRLAITTGELLAPAIERVANRIRERLEDFRDYVKANKEAITETLKWTAALGVVSIVGPPLVLLLSSLVTQFGALAKAMVKITVAGFTNPFTLMLISLYTFRAVAKQEGFWDDIWGGITTALDKVIEGVKGRLKTLGWVLYKTRVSISSGKGMWGDWSKAKESFGRRWEADYKHVMNVFAQTTKETAEEVVKGAASIGKAVGTALAEDIPAAVKVLTSALTGVSPALDAILDRFAASFAVIKEMKDLFMVTPSKLGGIGLPGFGDKRGEVLGLIERQREAIREINKILGDPVVLTQFQARFKRAMTSTIYHTVKWHDVLTDTFNELRDDMADTIEDFMNGGVKLTNFIEQMFRDVLSAFNRMTAEVLANKLFYMIFGEGMLTQPGSVTGKGTAGQAYPFFSRYTAPITPLEPPKITGKFKRALPNREVEINITNTGEPVDATVTGRRFEGDKYIIDVVMKAMNTDPNVRAQFGV